MPFVPLYLRVHSFIYLSILSPFTSLLRSFSSYETSQSVHVGVVQTGGSREKKKKKKKKHLAHLQAELVSHVHSLWTRAHKKHSGETIE